MYSRADLLKELSFTPKYAHGGHLTRRERAHRDWEIYSARCEGMTGVECARVWQLAVSTVLAAARRAAALLPTDGGVAEAATPAPSTDAGATVAARTTRARELIAGALADGGGRFRRSMVRNGQARRCREQFDAVLSQMVADGTVVEVLDANGAEWIALS